MHFEVKEGFGLILCESLMIKRKISDSPVTKAITALYFNM